MNHPTVLNVVGVAGSLRRASFNRALLRAAQQLQPETLAITIFDLEPLPLYNQDEDADSSAPAAVRLWRDALWSADALLIATPEYNSSVPGVLKNALDWASRPAQHQPLSELPIAIMGATPSMWGTARSQAQLRQTLIFPNAYVMNRPEVMVAQAHERFDPQGELIHAETRAYVHNLLVALDRWTRQVGRAAIQPA